MINLLDRYLEILADFYDNTKVVNMPLARLGSVHSLTANGSSYSYKDSKRQALFLATGLVASEQPPPLFLLCVQASLSHWDGCLLLRCHQCETIYVACFWVADFKRVVIPFRLNQVVCRVDVWCRLYEAFYTHLMLFRTYLSPYSYTLRKFNYHPSM